MTIDLGFAWLELPSGREVGIVDVPGHHRFIKNMLAGVGGIDLTLFVVAADDGWMPQSEEHLQILDLLEVRRGIVVLTKRDLVDSDWVELVAEEIRERLSGTRLAESPIQPVSSVTKHGLPELVALIDAQLSEVPASPDLDRPRLWIDRAFTVRGAGTVVTGTLAMGSFSLDQEVEILPSGRRARIRGLQSHKRSVKQIGPGSRVAVNLSGVDVDEIQRGNAVVGRGRWLPSRLVSVELSVPSSLAHPVRDGQSVKVYAGSAEITSRVRLLGEGGLLNPGEEGPAQLRLEVPLPLAVHDRLILRDPSHQATVAGAHVLDPHAPRIRGKGRLLASYGKADYRSPAFGGPRGVPFSVENLKRRIGATPLELLHVLLDERPYVEKGMLVYELPERPDRIARHVKAVVGSKAAVELPSFLLKLTRWEEWLSAVHTRLAAHHRRHPLQVGLSKETLRTELGLEPKFFEEAVNHAVTVGELAAEDAALRLVGHSVRFADADAQELTRLLQLFAQAPHTPPAIDELVEQHGFSPQLLAALVEQGRLVKVTRTLAFERSTFDAIREAIAQHIRAHGTIDVGQVRDLFQTSRKYALPLLEYLDQTGFTRRVGDQRVLTGRP